LAPQESAPRSSSAMPCFRTWNCEHTKVSFSVTGERFHVREFPQQEMLFVLFRFHGCQRFHGSVVALVQTEQRYDAAWYPTRPERR